MPKPNNSRPIILFWILPFFIASVFLGVTSFFSFRAGDLAISRLTSSKLHVSVELEGVRWSPWMGIRFERLIVKSPQGKEWLKCDKGDLRYLPGLPGAGAQLFLSDLVFPADLLRSLPASSKDLDLGQNEKVLEFEKATFFIDGSGPRKRLRILKMQSPRLELKGSVCWKRGSLEKASLAVRILSRAGDKRTLKCAYNHNHLSFYGRSGPLFRASWVPEP